MIRASIALGLVTSSIVIATGCGGATTSSSGGTTTASGSNTNNTNASRTSAYVSSDPQVQAGPAYGVERAGQGPAVAQRGVGMDAEHPVPACGPGDSYDYVASRFRCPDGTNPLGGDPAMGQRARLGNVGANSTGHIIDVYRVPCASGPIDVYVDMYGCPEMAGMLGQ